MILKHIVGIKRIDRQDAVFVCAFNFKLPLY